MNWYGGGFIPIIIYAMWGESMLQGAILTEAGDPLLTEAGDYLQIESV